MNVYEKINAQAKDRAALRMTAAKNHPLTKEMVRFTYGLSVESRPTEDMALNNLHDRLLGYDVETYYQQPLPLVWYEDSHKVCRRCGEDKPHMDYSPDKRNKDGLQAYCKHCRMEIELERRKAA